MNATMSTMVQQAIGALGGVLMLVALFLLWQRSRSGWLLLALGGEMVSWLFRLAYMLVPSLLSGASALVLVWQATALMVAAGLLGYALEQQPSRSR